MYTQVCVACSFCLYQWEIESLKGKKLYFLKYPFYMLWHKDVKGKKNPFMQKIMCNLCN